jgi:thioredoxin 1
MRQIKTLEDLVGYTGFVLFSAPWCSPCKGYKPVIESFCDAREFRLAEVNVDESRELAGTYGVRSVPTTFFFINGSPFVQKSGALTEQALNRLVP